MIFLTIGSHEPFDRLTRAVDAWAAINQAIPVFGQIAHIGSTGYRPQHFDWVETMPPDAYAQRLSSATLIVAHAGMGSIITALSRTIPIVIMPRRGHLAETRNDHQYATAKRFAGRSGIFVADDETALPTVIDAALAHKSASGPALSPYAEPELIDAIRAIVFRAR